MILTEKKLLERFTKNNCKKTNVKEFRVDDELYATWKGYDSSFSS